MTVSGREETAWARMLAGLALLRDGSFEEKLEVAEAASDWFRPLRFAGDDDLTEEVVESLRSLVRLDADDWIDSRMLESLRLEDTYALAPVYREALESPSPNLRWRAIRWYGEHEDPDALPALEDAWHDEPPAWVRADLITALARQGSPGRLDDFARLASDDEPAVAAAAIDALGDLSDREAIPRLEAIIRRGRRPARLEAIGALASWSFDDEALGTLLEATRDPDAAMRGKAVEAIRNGSSEEVARRLIEIAQNDEADEVRLAALEGLDGRSDPEIVTAITDILRGALASRKKEMTQEAIAILNNLDDPSAVPALLNMVPEEAAPLSVDFLVGYLSRDRETVPPQPIVVPRRPVQAAEDEEGAPPLQVVPPAEWDSVRCWEAPGVSGDPSDFERIPAGYVAEIQDFFEGGDDLWVSIEGPYGEDCWLPRRFLGPSDGARKDATGPGDPLQREFDLPLHELRTAAAARLIGSGLLQEFDPATEVSGARLSVDRFDPKQIAVLSGALGPGGNCLDQEILELLRLLRPQPRPDDASPHIAARP